MGHSLAIQPRAATTPSHLHGSTHNPSSPCRTLLGSILISPEAGGMLSRACLCFSLHQQSPNWKTTFFCLIGFDLSSIPPSLPPSLAKMPPALALPAWLSGGGPCTSTQSHEGRDVSGCQPARQGRTCRCRHCPACPEPPPPTRHRSAHTAKQMAAEEMERSRPAPGAAWQRRDSPGILLPCH